MAKKATLVEVTDIEATGTGYYESGNRWDNLLANSSDVGGAESSYQTELTSYKVNGTSINYFEHTSPDDIKWRGEPVTCPSFKIESGAIPAGFRKGYVSLPHTLSIDANGSNELIDGGLAPSHQAIRFNLNSFSNCLIRLYKNGNTIQIDQGSSPTAMDWQPYDPITLSYDCKQIIISMYGAGGGGAGATTQSTYAQGGGGAGALGLFVLEFNDTYTSSNPYYIKLSAGGSGGTSDNPSSSRPGNNPHNCYIMKLNPTNATFYGYCFKSQDSKVQYGTGYNNNTGKAGAGGDGGTILACECSYQAFPSAVTDDSFTSCSDISKIEGVGIWKVAASNGGDGGYYQTSGSKATNVISMFLKKGQASKNFQITAAETTIQPSGKIDGVGGSGFYKGGTPSATLADRHGKFGSGGAGGNAGTRGHGGNGGNSGFIITW